jgi:hypothetical protein
MSYFGVSNLALQQHLRAISAARSLLQDAPVGASELSPRVREALTHIDEEFQVTLEEGHRRGLLAR